MFDQSNGKWDFLNWLAPLLLGLGSSPFVTKLMSFWTGKRDKYEKDASIAKGITDAANGAVEIMKESMLRLEKEQKSLRTDIRLLRKELKAEVGMRVECQKILKHLEAQMKTKQPKSKIKVVRPKQNGV